jgi:hypothetical protein
VSQSLLLLLAVGGVRPSPAGLQQQPCLLQHPQLLLLLAAGGFVL